MSQTTTAFPHSFTAAISVALGLALLAACSSDTAPTRDTSDAFAIDASADAGLFDAADTPDDAAVDPPADAAVDTAADTAIDAPADTVDRTDELYNPTIVREFSLNIEPARWDTLRLQERTFIDLLGGPGCLDGPFDSPFTWFEASLTIDGQLFDSIDVRKKGFIGSLDRHRPGLKFDLGEYVDGQTYLDARHLTLNNAKQDPAVIRQCLGYWFAERAGLPTPRCSFATLAVNGVDFGVYVNVEPLKRAFVERWYGNDDGNFYEGTLSDFTDELLATFEAKNGDETRLHRPDLDAVRDALLVPDDELIARLESVVDLDQFMTFWAVEVLIMHVDGYAANRNNFYLYQDAATGLFQFVPWGVDGIFGSFPVDGPHSGSVYATGALARRLYAHPEGRRRYFERLDELLENAWDEEQLLRELERMTTLVLRNERDPDRREQIIANVEVARAAIGGRRSQIQSDRAQGTPELPPDEGPLQCLETVGSASATFETTWGSLEGDSDAWFDGEQRFEVSYDEEPWEFVSVGAAAGVGDDTGRSLLLVGVFGEDTLAALSVELAPQALQAGETEIPGSLVYAAEETGGEFVQLAWALVTLRLDVAEERDGAPVRGSLDATLLGFVE